MPLSWLRIAFEKFGWEFLDCVGPGVVCIILCTSESWPWHSSGRACSSLSLISSSVTAVSLHQTGVNEILYVVCWLWKKFIMSEEVEILYQGAYHIVE